MKPKLSEIALLRVYEFDLEHSVIFLLKKIQLQYGMLAFPFGLSINFILLYTDKWQILQTRNSLFAI